MYFIVLRSKEDAEKLRFEIFSDEETMVNPHLLQIAAYFPNTSGAFSLISHEDLTCGPFVLGKITIKREKDSSERKLLVSFDKRNDLAQALSVSKDIAIVLLRGTLKQYAELTALAHFRIDLSKHRESERVTIAQTIPEDISVSSPDSMLSEEDSVIMLPKKRKTKTFIQNTRHLPRQGKVVDDYPHNYGYIFEDGIVTLPQRSGYKIPG